MGVCENVRHAQRWSVFHFDQFSIYIPHIKIRWLLIGLKEKINNKQCSPVCLLIEFALMTSSICLPFRCQASSPVLHRPPRPSACFRKQKAHCRPRGQELPIAPPQSVWSGSGDCSRRGCLAEGTRVQHTGRQWGTGGWGWNSDWL